MNASDSSAPPPCFHASSSHSPSLRPSPRPYLCRSDHGHVENTYHLSYSQRRSFSRSHSHSKPRHQHPHSVPLPTANNCSAPATTQAHESSHHQLSINKVNFLHRRTCHHPGSRIVSPPTVDQQGELP